MHELFHRSHFCALARLTISIVFGLMPMVGAFAQTATPSARCTDSTPQIYERDSPAVVFINITKINPWRVGSDRIERALGSGFIFDKDGLILTNSHVVFGAQRVSVTLDDGSSFPAQLVGIDPLFDLAVIRIKADKKKKQPLPVLRLGESGKLKVGDSVIAIGNPLGLDQTLTHGIISALNRELPETPLMLARQMIQTDTAINPGNSGGPLLNLCGEAVGITSEVLAGAQNIGFAVPIDLIKSVLPSLIEKGRIIRPWLGFHGQLVDESMGEILRLPVTSGLLIEVVDPESPAEKAKLQGGSLEISIDGNTFLVGGDTVTSINGTALKSRESYSRALNGLKVGSKIELEVFRAGKIRTVSYTLPERPILPGDVRE